MIKMRLLNAHIDELVKNGGELRTGPINSLGVLRLALDLKDARVKIKELEEEIEQLGYEINNIRD